MVATHITAANVAVGARVITGIDYPVICVPTDYEVEVGGPIRTRPILRSKRVYGRNTPTP